MNKNNKCWQYWAKSFLFDEFFFNGVRDWEINIKHFVDKHLDDSVFVSLKVLLDLANLFLSLSFQGRLKLPVFFLQIKQTLLFPSFFRIKLLYVVCTCWLQSRRLLWPPSIFETWIIKLKWQLTEWTPKSSWMGFEYLSFWAFWMMLLASSSALRSSSI